MIELQNIQVKYGDYIAVDHVNLRINEDDFFTFLGPSGCGKTTTLRAIAGLTPPSQGKVLLDGQDITHTPVEKRQLGMVFQSYALFPTMTAYENIAYGLRVQHMAEDRIREKVHRQAEIVDLHPNQLAKNVSQLSGGQQQRVAIARTLIMEPRVILFDEPLSNLDAKLRKQLRKELKEIQAKTGLTAIYVTHDQEEALELSDQLAVFQRGKIEQIGSPIEVYNHSQTEFVLNFIGDANCLSPGIIQLLNHQLETPLPTDHIAYIRWENIRPQALSQEDLILEGSIIDRKFQGNSLIYQVQIEDASFQFMVLNQPGHHFEIGHSIKTYLNPSDIMTYPLGGAPHD